MRSFPIAIAENHSRQLVACLGVLLLFSLVLTWNSELDQLADDYLDEAIVDAGTAYAAARAINAVISVIQSIEISVSLGAGVAVNLGEALDPLNDLIERFSSFVLVALVGIGIQKLALVASASITTKVISSIVMLVAWVVWLVKGSLNSFLKKLLILMILVRFAFAAEVGLSWVLDKAYFEHHQQEALSTLDIAENKLSAVRDEYMSAIEDQGMFRGAWTTARNLLGADDQESVTELTIGAIVQLLVILFVRSILLPIAFLWLLYMFLRRHLQS